jgi:hypothetical protein
MTSWLKEIESSGVVGKEGWRGDKTAAGILKRILIAPFINSSCQTHKSRTWE